jgi:hypothetical protein
MNTLFIIQCKELLILTAPLTVLSIRYALVFYVNSSLLTAPRTVLSIRYPPVVYMLTAPLNVLKHKVLMNTLFIIQCKELLT